MFEEVSQLTKTDWSRFGDKGTNELAKLLSKVLGDTLNLVHRGALNIENANTQYPTKPAMRLNAYTGGREWPDEGTAFAADVSDPTGGIVRFNTPVFSQLYARITDTTISAANGMAYVQAIKLPNGPSQPTSTGRTFDLYLGSNTTGLIPPVTVGQIVTYQHDFEGRAIMGSSAGSGISLFYLFDTLAAGAPEMPTGPVDGTEYGCGGSTWTETGNTRSVYNVLPCEFSGFVWAMQSGNCPDRYQVLTSCHGVGGVLTLDVLLACPAQEGLTISFPRATLTIPGGTVTNVAPCTIDTCCASSASGGGSSGGGASSSGGSVSSGGASSFDPYESSFSFPSGSSGSCASGPDPDCTNYSSFTSSDNLCTQRAAKLRVRFEGPPGVTSFNGTCASCDDMLWQPCGHILTWNSTVQRWEGQLACGDCGFTSSGRSLRLELRYNCPVGSTLCPGFSGCECLLDFPVDCPVDIWGDSYTQLYFEAFGADPADYAYYTIAFLWVQLGEGLQSYWPVYGALLAQTHSCSPSYTCDATDPLALCVQASNFNFLGTLQGGLGTYNGICTIGQGTHAQVAVA